MPIQQMDGNGDMNFISLATIPIPELTFTNKFKELDGTKRLHWLADLKNTTPALSDATVKSWNDGTETKLTDGQLSIEFTVAETDPLVAYALGSLECASPATYLIDIEGTLVGDSDPAIRATEQKLYPIPVDRWTVAQQPFGSDTEVAMCTVTVYFPKGYDISRLTMVMANQHGLNMMKNYEPKKAYIEVVASTITSIDVKVFSGDSGILGFANPVSGLVVADFDLVVDGAPVTVTSVTETATGEYTLAFAAQTVNDDFTVSVSTAKYVGSASDVIAS